MLRDALKDSEVGVRRKVAFLVNGLLLPSAEPESVAVPANVHGAAAGGLAPHASDSAPVHANTHASMLSDPSSTQTSTQTLKAFKEHGIASALVDALVEPVPFGPDGDGERDEDLEEKLVRYVLSPFSRAKRKKDGG